MQYDFNGVQIDLKDKLCRLWDEDLVDIEPTANLYIRLTNQCNANCKFCAYHGDKTDLHLDKLESALKELRDRKIIYKIQITGGEPTLEPELLYEVCKLVRAHFPDAFIGINSNGSNLDVLKQVEKLVDNFAISRHHYDDNINREIFGTSMVADSSQLKQFIRSVGSYKVHLSCTLIKDYIGEDIEMKKYLEFCSSIGCEDVGFVSLMAVNDFSRQQRVDFNNTGIDDDPEFYKYRQFTKCDNCCKCANYIYFCHSTGRLIDIYGRYVMKHNKSQGMLSFDIDTLREGFAGVSIPIKLD